MLTNDQLDHWDSDHFFYASSHVAQYAHSESPNRIITGGEGVFIEDCDGNRLLDAFAGLYYVNIGDGRQEVDTVVSVTKTALERTLNSL